MTDHTELILFKRTDAPGQIYGVPKGDLTQRGWDRLAPDLRREVEQSPLYAGVGTDEAPDPLGEIDTAAYLKLSPAEKGARTREANKRAKDVDDARIEAEALAAADQQAAVDQLGESIDALQGVLNEAGDAAGEGDDE